MAKELGTSRWTSKSSRSGKPSRRVTLGKRRYRTELVLEGNRQRYFPKPHIPFLTPATRQTTSRALCVKMGGPTGRLHADSYVQGSRSLRRDRLIAIPREHSDRAAVGVEVSWRACGKAGKLQVHRGEFARKSAARRRPRRQEPVSVCEPHSHRRGGAQRTGLRVAWMWRMAASISSSRPARSPAMVGVRQMSGTIPTRWVGRLSG